MPPALLLAALSLVLLLAPATAGAAPPTCGTPSFSVEPDVPAQLPTFLEGGCFDPDANPLHFTIVDGPQHGTVSVVSNTFGDAIVYDPVDGYAGEDSFTFRADDGAEQSEVATYEITVLEPNGLPMCVDASLEVARDGVLPLDPYAACSDPEGDELTAWLLEGPSHGTLIFPPDLAYVPDPGYVGADQILYYVIDSRGGESEVAVLDITVVGPVTQPPAATGPALSAPRPPAPPRPLADRTAPTVRTTLDGATRLATVRKRGLKVRLRSDEAGTARLTLTVGRALARRLGLATRPRGPVVIGRIEQAVTARATTLSIVLTRKARRAVRTARAVPVRLVCEVTDPSGNRRSLSRTLVLRR